MYTLMYKYILTCRFTLSMTQPFVILNTEKTEDSPGDIGGRVFGESEASGFELDIFEKQTVPVAILSRAIQRTKELKKISHSNINHILFHTV